MRQVSAFKEVSGSHVRWRTGWVVMWACNVALLAALAFLGVGPRDWTTAFLVFFLVPEMLGLVVKDDAYPPLTYVVARYVPRWIPHAVTFGIGVFLVGAWIPVAQHPLVVSVIIAAFVGWLTNHWTVTYESGVP
jgi:hypothetical protein